MKSVSVLRLILAAMLLASVPVVTACSGSTDPGTTQFEIEINADPISGSAPLTVTFSAVVLNGTASGFTWNFGDGSEPGNGQTTTHTYEAAGTFRVTLFGAGSDGAIAESTVSIQVNEADPLVLESLSVSPDRGIAPLTVNFSATVLGGTPPIEYIWDFGDISQSAEEAPEHTYPEVGEYLVTLMVTDGGGASVDATATVTVVDSNQAPTAEDVDVTTEEDTAVVVTLDASDPDDDDLTYTIEDEPANGTLTGDAPALTYTPDDNFAGDDTFTYTASDGIEDSNEATVTVTVTDTNDAPVAEGQDLSTTEDGALNITLTATDPDEDDLTWEIVAEPTNGTLTGTAPALTYTPKADFSGLDTFNFRVNDGTVDSNVAVISIDVVGEDDPPVANDMTLTTDEDVPLDITFDGADPDAATPRFTVVQPSEGGAVTITDAAAGEATFTPTDNYSGVVTFTYTLTGDGASDDGEVTITVNAIDDKPVAVAATLNAREDTRLNFMVSGTDVETAALDLTYRISTQAAHGEAVLDGASVSFTPDDNFNGSDAFEFIVNDGDLDSEPGVITVNVAAVNDKPTAAGLSLTTPEEADLVITMDGDDVDGDTVWYTLVSAPRPDQGTLDPAAGSIVVTENPVFTFQPADGFNGEVVMTYRVFDGTVFSDDATITVDVTSENDPPVANDDAFEINEGESLSVAGNEAVTLNDTDPEGDELSAELETDVAHGTLNLRTDGTLTYDPPDDAFNGEVTFTYFAVDESEAKSESAATVTITVRPFNDRPEVTGPASATVAEDGEEVITLTGEDEETEDVSFYVLVSGLPDNGTLSGLGEASTGIGVAARPVTSADDEVTYRPDPDYPHRNDTQGADAFTVVAWDGAKASAPFEVQVQVVPVNDKPVADPISIIITETGEVRSAEITLTATDADEDDGHTFRVVGEPSNGSLEGTPPNVTYTADPEFLDGDDSFTYVADDGTVESDEATVSITVRNTNDPPVVGDQTLSTNEDEPLIVTVTATDPDDDPVVFKLGDDVDPPEAGSLSAFNRTGERSAEATFTPSGDFFTTDGTVTFTYFALDGAEAESNEGTITITVDPVNDAPQEAHNSELAVAEGATAVITASNLRYTDVDDGVADIAFEIDDSEGESLYGVIEAFRGEIWTALGVGDSFSQAEINAGSVRFVHGGGPPAARSGLQFLVSDGEAEQVPGFLEFDVSPINDVPEIDVLGEIEVDEGVCAALTSAILAVSDEESPAGGLRFRIVSGINGGVGYLRKGEVRLADGDTFLQSLVISGDQIRYCHEGEGTLTEHDLSMEVTDGEHVVEFDLTVDITLTNDPPVEVASGPVRVNEGAAVTIVGLGEASMLLVTDEEDAAGGITFTLDSSEFPGSISAGGDVLGAGDSFTQQDVNDGLVVYTASEDEPPLDPFTVSLSVEDSGGLAPETGTVQLGLDVRPVNDPPAPKDDAFTDGPVEDSLWSLDFLEVLENDEDPDNSLDELTITDVGSATNGSVELTDKGIDFTPNPDFNGVATFSYLVEDPAGLSGTATVSITFAPDPDAPRFVTTPPTTAQVDALYCYRAEAQDPDGDDVGYVFYQPGEDGGSLPAPDWLKTSSEKPDLCPAAEPGGTVLWIYGTPGNPDEGDVTLVVEARDAELGTPQQFVLTVTNENDPPTATGQTVDGTEDIVSFITLIGDDPDGTTPYFQITTHPVNGTVKRNLAGFPDDPSKWVFIPDEHWNGDDSFQFIACDGVECSDPATVVLNFASVNDLPTITSIPDVQTNEDPEEMPSVFYNIDDPDHEDGDLGFDWFHSDDQSECGESGNTSLVASMTFKGGNEEFERGAELNLGANQFGCHVVLIRLTDPLGGVAESVFAVSAEPVNDDPVVDPITDPDAVDETDSVVTIVVPFTASDVDNDLTPTSFKPSRVAGDPIADEVEFAETETGFQATVTVSADIYGTETLRITALDGDGGSHFQEFTYTVNPTNDAPTIMVTNPDPIDEDSTTGDGGDDPFPVNFEIDDIDDDELSVEVADYDTGLFESVTITGDGASRSAEILLVANANGTGTFTLSLTDGHVAEPVTAEVTVTVTAVNDAPDAVADMAAPDGCETQEVERGASFTPVDGCGVLENDSDIEDDSFDVVDWSTPVATVDGSLVTMGQITAFSSDGIFTYVAPGLAFDFTGEVRFSYTIEDTGGATDSAFVAIQVTVPANVVDGIGCVWKADWDCDSPQLAAGEEACFTVAHTAPDGTVFKWFKDGGATALGTGETFCFTSGSNDEGYSMSVTAETPAGDPLGSGGPRIVNLRARSALEEALGDAAIIADDGWMGAPLGSIDAYVGAFHWGANAIEMSVWMSVDGVAVVSARDSVGPFECHILGSEKPVTDLTQEQLQNCDLAGGEGPFALSPILSVSKLLGEVDIELGGFPDGAVLLFRLNGDYETQQGLLNQIAEITGGLDGQVVALVSEDSKLVAWAGEAHSKILGVYSMVSWDEEALKKSIEQGVDGIELAYGDVTANLETVRCAGLAALVNGRFDAAEREPLGQTELWDMIDFSTERFRLNGVLSERVSVAMQLREQWAFVQDGAELGASFDGARLGRLMVRGNINGSGTRDLALCGPNSLEPAEGYLSVLFDGGPAFGGTIAVFKSPEYGFCEDMRLANLFTALDSPSAGPRELVVSGLSKEGNGYLMVFELDDVTGQGSWSGDYMELPAPRWTVCETSDSPCADGGIVLEDLFKNFRDQQGIAFGGFGASLMAGNIDEDDFAELVVGAPGTDLGDGGGGAVVVLDVAQISRANAGLTGDALVLGYKAWGSMVGGELSQGDKFTCGNDRNETFSELGYDVALGDLDMGELTSGGTRVFNITAGVPGYDIDGSVDAGAFSTFTLDPGGPFINTPSCVTYDQFDLWDNVGMMLEEYIEGARLGEVLKAGEFGCDADDRGASCSGAHSLAVSMPWYPLKFEGSTVLNAGMVLMIQGRNDMGLDPLTAVGIHQTEGASEIGQAHLNEYFGLVLNHGQINSGDSYTELYIGFPDSFTGTRGVGAVAVIPGARDIGVSDHRLIRPGRCGNDVARCASLNFGVSTVSGDFDGAGLLDDVVIGIQGYGQCDADPNATGGLLWEPH